MIVLDASVMIAVLDEGDAHHDRAVQVLAQAQDRSDEFAMNAVTIAEVLVGPTRAGREQRVLDDLERLAVRETALGAPRKLAALRVATGLRLPDCCVLLSAEEAGADLATFDDRLAEAARERGLRVR